MSKTGQEQWQEAETFAELCELGALYVEGKIDFFPTQGDFIDEETSIIATTLAGFNRSGFLTTGSQPGEVSDEVKQRAWVEGYAQLSTSRRLAKLDLYTDLIVFIHELGRDDGYQIPITVADSHPYTWAGTYGTGITDAFGLACSGAAFDELLATYYVVIIDPHWGRNDYLWELVAKELNEETTSDFSPDPHPDLELDTDFLGYPVD